MTLETHALSTLPLAGRSFISLVTLAPGVGRDHGRRFRAVGTPGSGVDNYSTETAVDVSANGQGTVANKFIVDGLERHQRHPPRRSEPDAESGRHPGKQHSGQHVLRGVRRSQLHPDGQHDEVGDRSVPRPGQRLLQLPEHVREYRFPGRPRSTTPFHSNNFSVRSAARSSRTISSSFSLRLNRCAPRLPPATRRFTPPDPAFATWAAANYPNTFGTHILNTYAPTRIERHAFRRPRTIFSRALAAPSPRTIYPALRR